MEHDLYQWQEDCLERWSANNFRGMVQAVTGSGKTRLALAAASRLQQAVGDGLRVRIVVPTGALMRQWDHALKDLFAATGAAHPRDMIGLRGNGHKTSAPRPYMIYVINSARYELARQILSELRSGAPVLLIADECHHYVSGQNQLIFEFLPYIRPDRERFYSLGLSATLPSGQDGRTLASLLGRRIYSYDMAKAAAQRTICPYDVFHISLSFRPEEADRYQELSDRMTVLFHRLLSACPALGRLDPKERYGQLQILAGSRNKGIAEAAAQYMGLSYKRKSLVCMASDRIGCADSLIRHLGIRDKILVFGERIEQAEALYARLQDCYPGKVGRYHSKLGPQANKNALERFLVGDIRILIACRAIDEGIDVPDASTGIILSGTSTQRQRIQRLGRIIRQKEGKRRASLYYLHILDSSEDICFLPDTDGQRRVIELSYLPETDTFLHPPYDQAAERLLAQMGEKRLPKDQLAEAGRCLEHGRIRADWLLDGHAVEDRIQEAASIKERNYWVCMKKMQAHLTGAGRNDV